MPILACDSKNEKVVPGRSTAFALPVPLRPEEEVYCIVLSCTCCHRDAIAKEAASVITVHPVMRQCVREMGGIIAFTETERGRSFTRDRRKKRKGSHLLIMHHAACCCRDP